MAGIVYSEEQIDWLKRNYPYQENRNLALHLGVSESSLHRLRKKYNLHKDKAWEAEMRKAKGPLIVHIKRVHGTLPPKGYKIPNREAKQFKKGESLVDRFGEEKAKEVMEANRKALKHTWASEKRRILFGLPQKTKLFFRYDKTKTKRMCEVRYRLRKKGYEIEGRGGTEVYFIEGVTREDLRLEARAEKLGFDIYER